MLELRQIEVVRGAFLSEGAFFIGVAMSRKETVTKLLESMEDRLNTADGKASVADYIRLLQYERELDDEQQPREMKVTWSEPLETYDTDE